MEVEKYLTPKDIQQHLQIGKDKAYKLCALKGFPAIKINSTYRINSSKYFKWLQENESSIVNL